MTVVSDLKKAIASAETAQGTYMMAAESTEDQSAKQMFDEMKKDMDKHLTYLNSRLQYVSSNNSLNSYQQQQEQ